ncbi:MAG: hypothetical protein F4123_08865, partial [Gemmatimonadetes bacterium]|nr:hypothetical protein [Gemmatimonadota bacterium]
MTHRQRTGSTSSPCFPLLLAFAVACGDPPVPLPESAPLPTHGVHLNMTYSDLTEARPGAVLVPDTGVVEVLFRGFYHYGFTSNPPRRGSRLVYIDHVRDEMEGEWARREWDTLVVALAAELELEPRCAEIDYARLKWRRALLEDEGSPVAAAVEVVAVTTGDPEPGEAELITRVWLTEYAAPVSRFLQGPEGVGGDLLQ